MPWIPLAAAGVSAIGGLIAQNQAKKAAQGAANGSQVNIGQLDAKTREIAQKNALQSAELERQLTPEVPKLRSAANNALLDSIGSSPSETSSESFLMNSLGQNPGTQLQTPLLRAAIAKAQADLQLGGQLPLDVRNLVTRRALSTAGSVTPGGLGLGRDISARDLGLTSLDLENQRLQNASQLGGQELGLETDQNNINFNNAANHLNIIQLLQSLNNQRYGRALGAAQYGESINKPIVGLDPGSVADVTVGNSNNRSASLRNQADIAGKQSQNYFNFGGQLLGYNALGGYKPTTPTQPPGSSYGDMASYMSKLYGT